MNALKSWLETGHPRKHASDSRQAEIAVKTRHAYLDAHNRELLAGDPLAREPGGVLVAKTIPYKPSSGPASAFTDRDCQTIMQAIGRPQVKLDNLTWVMSPSLAEAIATGNAKAEHEPWADAAIRILRKEHWSIWSSRAVLLDESELSAALVGCDWLTENGYHRESAGLRWFVDYREARIAASRKAKGA